MPSAQQLFTELIEANKGIIFKVIRLYVFNKEDERDLFQEICYQAWKSYPRFKGESKFSTWLYRVSLNVVLTFRRRPALVEHRDELVSKEVITQDRADEVDALYHVIRGLNEIDRMIISLHLDGYENEEIAEISGLTKNNVAVRLHRSKEVITRKLKGVTP